MAFPASSQTQADALEQSLRFARSVKNELTNRSAVMAAGNVTSTYVLDTLAYLVSALNIFNAAKTVPGIGQYAKDQFDDAGLDIVAEANTMIAAIESARDAIISAIPNDGTYMLMRQKPDVNGAIVDRTFTPAQSAGLQTALNAVIATIS